MSKELAVRSVGSGLDLAQLGDVLSRSGYFADTKDAAQAIVKVLAGQELGIGPIAAMTGVYIVNGRVAIGANLMAGAVKGSGKYDYRVAELTDEVCRLVFFQGGKELGVSEFTLKDAKRAATKNLDKFPRNMLFARALSNGVRWYTPDVFHTTVYTPEELRGGEDQETTYQRPAAPAADPATGEVIDAEAVVDATPTMEGDVQTEPKSQFDPTGALHLNIKVGGYNFLIRHATPQQAHIEAGDYVKLTYHPEEIKGKTYNVVDSLEGDKNADGDTPWEARAAALPEGASFTEPVEAAA